MRRNLFVIVFLSIFFLAGSAWAESITVVGYGGTYNTGIENIFGKPFTKANCHNPSDLLQNGGPGKKWQY
jgi:hypothetical protein